MILAWDEENYKGGKEQRPERNTNKIMMKLEQDAATKADIWLETNGFGDKWSTRQKVRDIWWKTQHTHTQRRTGERAGHHHSLRQTDDWRQINLETDKLGETWRETHDERQVKTQKRHSKSRTPLDSVGDTWRERHAESWTPQGSQVRRDTQRGRHH